MGTAAVAAMFGQVFKFLTRLPKEPPAGIRLQSGEGLPPWSLTP